LTSAGTEQATMITVRGAKEMMVVVVVECILTSIGEVPL
jgi:hypothetical protein